MVTKYTAIAVIVITILSGAFITVTYLTSANAILLNSAGASFPYPLIDKMITEYNRAKPYIQVNYQPSGSGAGITALTDKTVFFAGSDAPLSNFEREKALNTLHIPETIGSIAITYNIPNIPSGLKLTGQIVADIFEGKITMWNDVAITNINNDIILPAETIKTVHRSESSGTTFVFTGYLNTVSTSWKNNVGQSKTIAWPAANDVASSGNTGVAQIITSTLYSIGYVELAYVLQADMTVAAIQNPSGNYILPTLNSTTIAAQSVALEGLPAGNADWSHVNLLNAKDANAYPIVSFSYILVYQELNVIPGMTQECATAFVQFLLYMVNDGQNLANSSNYAPLPVNVVDLNTETIKLITFNGQTITTLL
ncbi:MAG: phosphate ABC transporter substrate-binding protein PstS [Nitrososphaerota archaeon]|jgi:phosphate transport system permease protein/phosphate transport system substrate-binding protein|nr:phosphate ABC transporter substrate-binding protein PstS [Nitrososphaerota archaeon]